MTGWLVYDNDKALPTPVLVNKFNELDDFGLVPYDKKSLLPEPDQIITLDVTMGALGDGKP